MSKCAYLTIRYASLAMMFLCGLWFVCAFYSAQRYEFILENSAC